MLFNRKPESRDRGAPERPPAPGEPPAVAEPRRGPGHPGTHAAPTRSFIDASLTIVGDLHSEGDVQIDGRICGNVACAQLIVGKDAAITGTVKAEQAIVRGSITGTIRACVVILQETARVKSDIAYTLLAIDDGAEYEGAVHRSESPLQESDASPLGELQQLVTPPTEGPDARPDALAGVASREGESGGQNGVGSASPRPDRRNANGHADAQR
jgi:cytoskeletal protein CcmA (bactofilin family)